MYLQKLLIHGIRNIASAELSLSPGLNIFYGNNGSGKTSILEAVHLLSHGRSFRTRNLKALITHHARECTCFGNVVDNRGREIPVGVSRSEAGDFVFKVAGEKVNTASSLAQTLPLQLINAQSFQLLEGAPGARRGFIDWGVFHVEHNYRELWVRYQRCLKHRNSLLRRGKIDRLQLSVWDREFCSLAERIHSAREAYLEKLLPCVEKVLDQLESLQRYSFRYVPGWDRSQELAGLLESTLKRDMQQGFTGIGPHRADLKIFSGKSTANEILSRGQTKLLIYGLKLAQGQLFKKETGNACIYMLDDLPAELDRTYRLRVAEVLWEMGVQVLVTGVERGDMDTLWLDDSAGQSDKTALFHVEQGVVTRLG